MTSRLGTGKSQTFFTVYRFSHILTRGRFTTNEMTLDKLQTKTVDC